jgi:chorismate synthase
MSCIGNVLRITTYGESHGKSIGCIIEGFPSGFMVDINYIQKQLNRRKPGQGSITTPRNEADNLEVQSGIQNALSLGTPICFLIKNLDMRPSDYDFRNIPRPGHADLSYYQKYGINSDSGGGRASARETAARVAAGGLCLQYLEYYNINISAWVSSLGSISMDYTRNFTRQEVDTLGCIENDQGVINTRCPDPEVSLEMYKAILKVLEDGDSLGGVICCCATGLDSGFLEYFKPLAASVLGYAVMSIPSVKGFKLLKNTDELIFEVCFKPVSTIGIPQKTSDWEGNEQTLECKGRHDPCVLTRAVPIVESMTSIVLLDSLLMYQCLS